ncbi:MAG: hypothetical protein DRH37_07890 [Deltaproteobacteria bacterium]|nr:MAG: hypothetical protein DRH37_07890 [Deltaproteobacteria bacterium]
MHVPGFLLFFRGSGKVFRPLGQGIVRAWENDIKSIIPICYEGTTVFVEKIIISGFLSRGDSIFL